MRGRLGLLVAFGSLVLTVGISMPAVAGSACFKNLDQKDLYLDIRYRTGKVVEMQLKPGEKRRFDDVDQGDVYCYSFSPMAKTCDNQSPVHLTSCSNPKFQ
jgi:hypothetical protein